MTDLERARELIAFASYSESPVGHVKRVAAALAAARREGEIGMREKAAQALENRGMASTAAVILALPLTPKEPT